MTAQKPITESLISSNFSEMVASITYSATVKSFVINKKLYKLRII